MSIEKNEMQYAPPTSPWVQRWLALIAAMIFAMVIVGGATRLTKSGLSITEWDPILGAIPPLNELDWQTAFAKYQQSSQYKLANQGMSIADFHFIFWWEWAHRLLGRLLGVVFIVPFLFFAITRRLPWHFWPKLAALFVFGFLQGALGWYMVASGLENRVEVSQYRLAAHLTTATALYAAVVWVVFTIDAKRKISSGANGWTALIIVALVFLQIAAGGFVAGLGAGQGYNTWPLMDGNIIPGGLGVMQPAWRNFFENALTVQFDHRMLAYLITFIALWQVWRNNRASTRLFLTAIILQASLGIATLLLHVPLAIALIHQGGALLVLTAAVWNLYICQTASD